MPVIGKHGVRVFDDLKASTGATIYFQDAFESGDLSAWSGNTANCTVQSTIKHSGTYALQILFNVTQPSSQEGYVYKSLTGLMHAFIRGYVYFKTPEADATPNTINGRKMVWVSDIPPNSNVNPILNGVSATGGVPTPNNRLQVLSQSQTGACALDATPHGNLATLEYDTWYCIEHEIQLNTPGVSDGIRRVWVTPDAGSTTQVYSSTTENLQGSCNRTLGYWSVGRQASPITTSSHMHEYRYWDDVVISDSYIGP
jgi:hypothetical protein